MMKHTLEFDEKCKHCNGTGLYTGMGEKRMVAVVCHTCEGTGCHHVKFVYEDFEGRQQAENITRVHECNPGIFINDDPKFGGISYQEWLENPVFPEGTENRLYTCPAWWFQNASKDKPEWNECGLGRLFADCEHFPVKDACWRRWDKER